MSRRRSRHPRARWPAPAGNPLPAWPGGSPAAPRRPVSAGRIRAWIDESPWNARCQTAYALPAASTETWGDCELSRRSEIVSAGSQAPPGGTHGGLHEAGDRRQTAIAVPAGVTAICGPVAPGADEDREDAPRRRRRPAGPPRGSPHRLAQIDEHGAERIGRKRRSRHDARNRRHVFRWQPLRRLGHGRSRRRSSGEKEGDSKDEQNRSTHQAPHVTFVSQFRDCSNRPGLWSEVAVVALGTGHG